MNWSRPGVSSSPGTLGKNPPIKGGPPALPGRQQKFDISRSRPPMKLGPREPPRTRREFHDGRLREPKPPQMGVQIPCGVHSQVPQEDALRGVATTSRGSVSQARDEKEIRVEEGHLMPDHVHMMISIPPKYAVSQVIGYIKGKIHLAHQEAGGRGQPPRSTEHVALKAALRWPTEPSSRQRPQRAALSGPKPKAPGFAGGYLLDTPVDRGATRMDPLRNARNRATFDPCTPEISASNLCRDPKLWMLAIRSSWSPRPSA
jgi:REP element-mobilizing transposase RayT